jgi:hypothetical protein
VARQREHRLIEQTAPDNSLPACLREPSGLPACGGCCLLLTAHPDLTASLPHCQDEDGVPEMAVVVAMVANDALLFMAAEESENRTIIRSLREIGLEDAAQVI